MRTIKYFYVNRVFESGQVCIMDFYKNNFQARKFFCAKSAWGEVVRHTCRMHGSKVIRAYTSGHP